MSYKFNASHNTSGREDGRHVHTFRLVILLRKLSDGFVDFYEYEDKVKSLVERFRGKVINDDEDFAQMNPTIENICIFFWNSLGELFDRSGHLKLVQVKLGDSPTQSFSVSEEYMVMNRPVERADLMEKLEKQGLIKRDE